MNETFRPCGPYMGVWVQKVGCKNETKTVVTVIAMSVMADKFVIIRSNKINKIVEAGELYLANLFEGVEESKIITPAPPHILGGP